MGFHSLPDAVPPIVRKSVEWQQRTQEVHTSTSLPVFSVPKRVYALVDVAAPFNGRPEVITPVAVGQTHRGEIKVGEAVGRPTMPVVCFRTALEACRAPQRLRGERDPWPRVARKLLLLQVTSPDAVVVGPHGALHCSGVIPLALGALPKAGERAAQPRARWWSPAGGVAD